MGIAEEDRIAEQKPLIVKAEPPAPSPPAPANLHESEWSTGLCDCCAQPGGGALGCVALFLPMVQYGVIAEQLPSGATMCSGSFGKPACAFLLADMLGQMAHCSIWPGVTLIPTSALLHLEMRRHLRTKYGIKGNFFGDLCTTWWCGPCALAQETREMVIRARQQQQQQQQSANPTGSQLPSSQLPSSQLPGSQLPGHMFGHMFGHMIMTPPSVLAAQATAPASATIYNSNAMAMTEPPPATGVPVGYGVVPPTHVATLTLPVPCNDTAPVPLKN